METALSKSVSEITKPGANAVTRVIEGEKYGEEVGYDYWWEVKTMSGKTYRVSKDQADKLASASERAKFVGLDNDMVAVHQITGIYLKKSYFGPRSGGYEQS